VGFEPTNGGFADSSWKCILLVRLAFTPALMADFGPYLGAIVPKLFPSPGVNPYSETKSWAHFQSVPIGTASTQGFSPWWHKLFAHTGFPNGLSFQVAPLIARHEPEAPKWLHTPERRNSCQRMAKHLDKVFPRLCDPCRSFADSTISHCVLNLEEAIKHKMARRLHIRRIVKTDRTSAHERTRAIGGVSPDGSCWTLTQHQAVSQIEDGTSVFYIETPRGQRSGIIVAMDAHADKYLKTIADREQPERLLSLANCP